MSRIALSVALLAFLLPCCSGARQPKATGFSISVLESGESVLTDEDIATYVWDDHRILLTPRGVARWESFMESDRSHEPPIPKLSWLTGKQFVVTLKGEEMYRGHFSSMASSMLGSGVLLYDTLGLPRDEISLKFIQVGGTPTQDLRARPEIEAYFRDQGKLRSDEI